MSYEDDSWVEHCLGLCSALPMTLLSPFHPGQLVTSIKTARRATVVSSCLQWTTLSFCEGKTSTQPTNQVERNWK